MNMLPKESKKDFNVEFPVKWEVITPDVARSYLGMRPENDITKKKSSYRLPHAHYYNALIRDMSDGKWITSSNTIAFDRTGALIDGQQRCLSIVSSNIPQKLIVVRNLPEEAIKVIDTGRARTFSDLLQHKGEVNAKALSAVIKTVFSYDNGFPLDSSRRVSNQEGLETLRENPALRASVGEFYRTKDIGQNTAMTFIHYITSERIGHDLAEDFCKKVQTGIGISDGDPALALRSMLIKGKDSRQSISKKHAIWLFIHAWNLTVARKKIKRISVPNTQPKFSQ